jgi:predicted nucleotidyltransferase component of viral defense system
MDLPFYLTGGTALGRYYLGHRYSEDLDFFVNADLKYKDYISTLSQEIQKSFNVNNEQSLFSDDFARFFIKDDEGFLKIEFVNEVPFRAGNPIRMNFGFLDTPVNILSNKLTALISRDEPKDLFDIIHIALNYSFKWTDVFYFAKKKAVINEIDIEERLSIVHVQIFQDVDWIIYPLDTDHLNAALRKVADDFLLGHENSLGLGKPALDKAAPTFF